MTAARKCSTWISVSADAWLTCLKTAFVDSGFVSFCCLSALSAVGKSLCKFALLLIFWCFASLSNTVCKIGFWEAAVLIRMNSKQEVNGKVENALVWLLLRCVLSVWKNVGRTTAERVKKKSEKKGGLSAGWSLTFSWGSTVFSLGQLHSGTRMGFPKLYDLNMPLQHYQWLTVTHVQSSHVPALLPGTKNRYCPWIYYVLLVIHWHKMCSELCYPATKRIFKSAVMITHRWGRTTCTQRCRWLATSPTWKRPWSSCLARPLCARTWTTPRRWRTTRRSRSARSLWMEIPLILPEHSLEVKEDGLCNRPSILFLKFCHFQFTCHLWVRDSHIPLLRVARRCAVFSHARTDSAAIAWDFNMHTDVSECYCTWGCVNEP